MHRISVGCDKHPELVLSVETGAIKHDWLQLDEKGKVEVWRKDASELDTFVMKIINHFTSCDGHMTRATEEFVD